MSLIPTNLWQSLSKFALTLLTLSITAIPTRVSACDKPTQRPNVVLILADDLGFNDTTLYGGTSLYQTPNLERLAAMGMKFSRAYTPSPLCSPTRAAILSGQSPARTGITTPACHLPQVVLKATVGQAAPPGSPVVMPSTVTRFRTEYFTLAEALKHQGYATGHFGKWHLGADPYSPLQHGFDVDVPHWPGPGPAGSYVAPWKFPDFDPDTPDQHIEDRMATEAVAFMEQHRDQPFFLNYWMFSVHAPFDAKRDLIEKYKPLIDPTNPQRSHTYAAMIESMDDAIGTLLDTLDRLQITDNTIIVFSSDNGGNMYNEVDGTTPTSNAPLRGGKANVFEGGIRVPCVVVWKDKIAAGSQNEALISSCDFYPTLLDLLAIEPQPGQIFDGISFAAALQGQSFERDSVFAYFPHATRVPDWLEPSVTVHHDHWKLIRIFHSSPTGAHRYQLFNLKQDVGEQQNLAAAHPEIVKDLDARIEHFLASTGAVVPVRNPDFDPTKYNAAAEGKAVPKGKAAPTGKAANKKKASENRASSAASAKMQNTLQPGLLTESSPELQGWKPRSCTANLKDGTLQITSTGTQPFLGLPANQFRGPAVISVRIQCDAGGVASIQHLPSCRANDVNVSREVEFPAASGTWQQIQLQLPVTVPLGIIRLRLPNQSDPVQVDWIEIATDNKTERWDF